MTIEGRLVRAVAAKEMADALRNRWLWAYAGGFALLAGALTLIGIPGARLVGFGGFGRTAASLVALVQILIPLMGLSLGAQTLAGAAERGTLRFLLAHPIGRTEAILGLFGGLSVALWSSILAGFGMAALVGTISGSSGDALSLLTLTVLSGLLATAMLSVGLIIGAMSERSAAAVGSAIVVWLALVFVGDLGIMGTALATRLPVGALFFSVVVNPVEAYRIAAVPAFGSSLDVLGPAGSYAIDVLGARTSFVAVAVLVAWTVIPTALAVRLFGRRDL